jgi:hypothetical protein
MPECDIRGTSTEPKIFLTKKYNYMKPTEKFMDGAERRIQNSSLVLGIAFFLIIHSVSMYGQRIHPPLNERMSNDPPVIPIGFDAYRMWDRIHMQRIGERAYMVSTYDREGANRDADSRNFLWMGEEEDQNYTMDIMGPGVLYFKRTNRWHGSPWQYVVDGNNYLIKETATSHPALEGKGWFSIQDGIEMIPKSTFIPEESFPEPLSYNWTTTKGANLFWNPVGFKESFKMAYSRTFYGTGYYIFKKYGNEGILSRPIEPWDITKKPDQDVIDLLNRSGTDIAPKDISKISGVIKLDKENIVFGQIDETPSVIRALKFILPMEQAFELERLRLRVTWDNRLYPSIDAPMALFFGAGTLYNRASKEYLVKGFPMNVRFDYDNDKVYLSCYYPMPFFRSARFELSGIVPGETEIQYEIRYEGFQGKPNQSSYFHATYKNIPEPELGLDMTFLDTKGIQGEDEWSGSFIGTSFIFTHNNFLPTLEGDPRFFFDGSRSPQAHGTGSEEWGGGGDYWGGETMTLPLAGHPVGALRAEEARHEKDLIHSAYRFLLADIMPFGNRARINFEHGGCNLSREHYEAVTYWYGLPSPSLIKTDVLDIGSLQSEQYHEYHSPHSSEIQEIISRFDGLPVDAFPETAHELRRNPDQSIEYQRYIGAEIFPALRETGRYTRGESEFSLHLETNNHGALLRRTMDWSFPNQKAKVFIADASNEFNPVDPVWEYAGIWYTPGSNTYMYSPARDQFGERVYNVRTSNRQFRDEEFLIPPLLTRNRSAIRVKIKFVPVDIELYPGYPFPKSSAWSEIRYEIYSYIMPRFSIDH